MLSCRHDSETKKRRSEEQSKMVEKKLKHTLEMTSNECTPSTLLVTEPSRSPLQKSKLKSDKSTKTFSRKSRLHTASRAEFKPCVNLISEDGDIVDGFDCSMPMLIMDDDDYHNMIGDEYYKQTEEEIKKKNDENSKVVLNLPVPEFSLVPLEELVDEKDDYVPPAKLIGSEELSDEEHDKKEKCELDNEIQ